MGKFGKKNEVSLNPLDFNIALLGESKIGKTTTAMQVCEMLAGENGYIHFDIGREEGRLAIQGIVSEPIEDFAKLTEVIEDITENKFQDYPDLKVVIWDTLDELLVLAEAESVRLYNRKNPDKKVSTVNEAWGGFGRGQDKAIELILEKIDQLKKVGVSSMVISHLRRVDITDPFTQETFSKLTADTTQKYFNSIKNKMHFVGVAYVDRDIVKERTGKKVNGHDVTKGKIVSESRVLSWRDDTYSVDSGSRFADIVDRIPFTAEDIVKSMKDAIEAEVSKSGKSIKIIEREQKATAKAATKAAEQASKELRENKIDTDRNAEIIEKIKAATADQKKALKTKMNDLGIASLKGAEDSIPTAKMEKLYEVLVDSAPFEE